MHCEDFLLVKEAARTWSSALAKRFFTLNVEDGIVELFRDRAERGILRNTGIGEHNVEPALLILICAKGDQDQHR